MNMEFAYKNYLDTSTMIYVSTGSTTVNYLFDREYNNYYISSGDNSDLTTTTIRIDFSPFEVIDRIALQNMNFKSFKIYHSSNTANTLTIANAGTTTSEWSTNSETSLYLILATPVTMTSITIEATATMVANSEKYLGEFWTLQKILTFDRNPDAKGYDAQFNAKQFKHEMSDGGTVVYTVSDKFEARIKRKYVDETEKNTLRTIHQIWDALTFIPFPTGTSWDERIYQVVWVGEFGFEQYTDNYKGNGYSGDIRLMESPK